MPTTRRIDEFVRLLKGFAPGAVTGASVLDLCLDTVGGEPVVSVHVYSRPIDSCVAFELETPRCYRRQLRYDSKFGVVITPGEVDNLASTTRPSAASSS